MSAHHPHPLRLDGQSRLGGLLLRDDHHGAQVDDASAAGGENQRPKMAFPPSATADSQPTELKGGRRSDASPTSLAEDILSSWTCLYR